MLFINVKNLKSVVFSDEIKIENNAFSFCSNLESFIIPRLVLC